MKDDGLAGIQCSGTPILREHTGQKSESVPGCEDGTGRALQDEINISSCGYRIEVLLIAEQKPDKFDVASVEIVGCIGPQAQTDFCGCRALKVSEFGLACILLEQRYSRSSNNKTNGKNGNCTMENT